jgi:hypothetical protein
MVDQAVNKDAEWESMGSTENIDPKTEADLSRVSRVFDSIHPSILDLDDHHPPWVYLFLERYSQTGNIMESAKYAQVSRQKVVDWRNGHADFREAMENAGKDAAEMLMLVAWNRALQYSDSVLIQLLRAHFPERFKQDAPPPALVNIQLQPYDYSSAIAGIVAEETDSAD